MHKAYKFRIYPTHRLNDVGSKKFTRKISSRIAEIRKMINQISNAHIAGQIDTHTLGSFVTFLRLRVTNMANDLLITHNEEDVVLDLMCVNLMTNILIGDIKNIVRKTQRIRVIEQQQSRLVAHDHRSPIMSDDNKNVIGWDHKIISLNPISLESVKDDITPETLIKKSKHSLARRGLKDTLY